MTLAQATLVGMLLLGQSAVVAGQSASPDWTQWRGPNRDGAVAAFTEPQLWPDRLTQQWKVDVGLGYTTPLVVGERVYMFSREGENEVLMRALDATSGARSSGSRRIKPRSRCTTPPSVMVRDPSRRPSIPRAASTRSG